MRRHPARVTARLLSESVALLPEDPTATLDAHFAKDGEAGTASHAGPLRPPEWGKFAVLARSSRTLAQCFEVRFLPRAANSRLTLPAPTSSATPESPRPASFDAHDKMGRSMKKAHAAAPEFAAPSARRRRTS